MYLCLDSSLIDSIGNPFIGDILVANVIILKWNRDIHNAAMREDQWKLVRPSETKDIPEDESTQKPLLYDSKNDLYEEKDVSEEYPIIYGTMKVFFEQWCRDVEFSRMQN